MTHGEPGISDFDIVREFFGFGDLFNLIDPDEHFGGFAAPGREVVVIVR